MSEAVEVAFVGHAIRPLLATWAASASTAARSDPGRIVESRAGRAGRDAKGLGDLDERQAHVVMQYEDRALLEGQASERPVEGVAVVDREEASGAAGPSTGRTRTFAAQERRRLASA